MKSKSTSKNDSQLPKIDTLGERIYSELYSSSAIAWDILGLAAKKLLDDAIATCDAEAANRAWFFYKIVQVRRAYISSIEHLRNGDFYEGWCELERVEIGLIVLRMNPFDNCKKFGVTELTELVANWQSLFPYRIFFSPEFAIRREECSICGHGVDPWSPCRHEPLRVYAGRECYRIMKELEVLGVSLVLDPVQKYSVARVMSEDANGKKIDQFNYSPVRFVIERLSTVFSNWNAVWTYELHPHSLFKDRQPDGPCPCESGRSYRHCCLDKDGVRRPHVQIQFADPPPAHLPNLEFSGYGN